MVVGRPATLDARARPFALRKDVVPGHTQSFRRGRPCCLHLDQARRDACRPRPSEAATDGHSCSIRAVKSSARRQSSASVGRRSPRQATGTPRYRHPTQWSTRHASVAVPFRIAGGDQHWTERAGALLSPLLHAAALESLPMRSVLRWIDRHDGATALEILSRTVGEDSTATDLLAGIVGTDSREQSGIWSTASGVLAAYRSEAALASTELPPLNAAEFVRGANTMYICSAGRRQHQFAPARRRGHR